jgi:tetratricopeptide (TPR) repeat protein
MSAKEYFTAKTLLEKLDQKSLKNFKQLAEIYECNGEIQKAIDCHKEILKHNNCSIETITTLLDYGVSLNEIDLSDTNEFIKEYVLHYSQTQRNEFDIAIQGFTAMDQKYKGNCFVLNMLGETLIKSEDLQSASQTYKKVLFFNKMRRLDLEGILGMDRYAMLLREAGSFNTLQRLSEDLMGFCDSPQSYIAQSFVSEMKQDYDQALLHIDKAILLNPRHYFSHQVRARILFALGKFGEASMSYRNAYKVCRDITTYEGLVKCYLKLDKVMEATSTGTFNLISKRSTLAPP